ncbi:hypothetical protein PCAR4_520020 [Paraburkholderia caribensis]|nr:hypothetical protein PCAR4_520020 [Paraburkholderia caribensis]
MSTKTSHADHSMILKCLLDGLYDRNIIQPIDRPTSFRSKRNTERNSGAQENANVTETASCRWMPVSERAWTDCLCPASIGVCWA